MEVGGERSMDGPVPENLVMEMELGLQFVLRSCGARRGYNCFHDQHCIRHFTINSSSALVD